MLDLFLGGKPMQRHSLKTRILDHAETRLLIQGYRGMRVDELARDVGISKRTLYEQFRTKEQMAREALARLVDGLDLGVDQILAREADEAEQLRAIVLLMCRRYARAQPPFYRDLETTPSLTELVEGSQRRTCEKIDEVIRAGIASGRFRTGLEPALVRTTFLAACEALLRPQLPKAPAPVPPGEPRQVGGPAVSEEAESDMRASAEAALEATFTQVLDVILNGVRQG